MVYGRKRRSTRRTYRRSRRALSTRNIFNNKGARSQASQISALKKRINHVYRQCRPETKLKEGSPVVLAVAWDDENPYALYSVDMPDVGTGDSDMTGNVCNIKDVHIYLDAELDMQYTAPNYALYGGVPGNLSYRIVAFCTKSLTDNSPDVDDIAVTIPQTTNPNQYKMNSIRPLNEGVSSKYDILYDRNFSVTQSRYSRKHHLRVTGSRIRKYITSQYMSFGKAQFYILIIPVITVPNTIISSEVSPANPVAVFRIMDKIAFTDP